MDMARKFLQMGYTRARRYANHRSGRKYDRLNGEELPQEADWDTNEKAQAARIFFDYFTKVKEDPDYQQSRLNHQQAFG
jgi:hypothetical protein